MNYQTARNNYLTRFIAIYKNTPSLAIWRAVEAQAFSNIVFEPPVLDLACGTGHFARILLGGTVITGCDLDANAVRVAANQKTLDALSLADARALPYSDCAFNSVLANCALEHIPDIEQVLAEISRVLKPKGILAFTVPSEHFNEFLLFPRFYEFLGLHSRARKHIQWYNAIQQHHHIDPLWVWENRIDIVGLKIILHRYYMPRLASLIFSLWDIMAKWSFVPRDGVRIHVQQFLLDRIPNRLLNWLLYSHLVTCYRFLSNADMGAGLLVVARKETERW